MAKGERSVSDEWKSGWPLVLTSAVGFSFYSAIFVATGLFIGPLDEEFGWSRTLLSSGPSIATITTALLSPFFGIMVDRFGTRRLVLPGIMLTIVAMASYSTTNGSPLQWVLLWLVFGVVSTTLKSTAWTAAVIGFFHRSRGMALGMTLSGIGIAQTVVPPLADWLINTFGWRMAFVWMALGWGGLTLALCGPFFYDVRDRARIRKRATGEDAPVATLQFDGLSGGEAIRNSALWRVAISNFVVMALTIGLGIHLVPILTESGLTRTHAAWLASLGGIAGIAGKLGSGYLIDRFSPNWVGGVILGTTALVFALLTDAIRSPTPVIIAMLVNGFTAGTKTQLVSYLSASYGGMKNFGLIYGVMAALMALASGLGPLFAGFVYDMTGGYGTFLLIGAAGCFMGAMLILSLPPYPTWNDPLPSESQVRT